MTVYLLKKNGEYSNCYYVEEFENRAEAVKHLDPYYNCRFVEGQELRLQLTEKEV